ncbi:MAG: hypothetical protein GF329_12125 [Candidatus Lokiarchaeota archaeon]|nr:hypothetical protein [Candidatus Lokiarchaeota archaeon]
MNEFTKDFFGENPIELKTESYKIIFDPINNKLRVYVIKENSDTKKQVYRVENDELIIV